MKNIQISKRKCTKKELLEEIKTQRKIIFNSSFIEFKGEKSFTSYLKNKFQKPIRTQENYIFIDNVVIDPSAKLGKLILDITNKHFNRATYDTKPLTFIINDANIHDVKLDLIKHHENFNDGYESIVFNETLFYQLPLIIRKNASINKISFKIRLVSINNFLSIKNHTIKPHKCYYFGSKRNSSFEDVSYMEVERITTKQIFDLFN